MPLPNRWQTIVSVVNRPYRVTPSMIVFVAVVPLYILIPTFIVPRAPHRPGLWLDDAIPLQPAWVLIYGPLYLWLILLPVFVVCQPDHIRRTVHAYLMVWLSSYVVFVIYPTIAPRSSEVVPGQGFAVWGLQALYDMDTPYNCLPSIHVAHSFVSALSAWRLHRGLGAAATAAASLVAVSTLFTKQHYVVDIIGGVLLAYVAYRIFLRGVRREATPRLERQVAPYVATAITAIVLGAMAVYGLIYWLGVTQKAQN